MTDSGGTQELVHKLEENPVLPVLPLRNTLLFPDMIIPLAVGRERSLKAVEQATRQEGYLAIVSQKNADLEEPGPEDLFQVGVMAKILRLMRVAPDNLSVIVHGQGKIRIEEFTSQSPFMEARVNFIANTESESLDVQALRRNVIMQYEKLANLSSGVPQELIASLERYEDANRIVDTIAFNLPVQLAEKQTLLEETDTLRRLKILTAMLARELQVLELGSKIQSEVADKVSDSEGAGRRRRTDPRDRGIQGKNRQGQNAQGKRRGRPERSRAPGNDAPVRRRIHGFQNVPRLAHRTPVEQVHQGQAGRGSRPENSG
ncbi:MAG: LON peptidase substrate-binding domain-containing protein [Acidobacteriota bacterium]